MLLHKSMKKELIAVTKNCMNEEFHDLLDTGGTVNKTKRHLSSKTSEISVLERYLELDGDQTKVSVKKQGSCIRISLLCLFVPSPQPIAGHLLRRLPVAPASVCDCFHGQK